MLKLIREEKAEKILREHDGWLQEISEKYPLPKAVLQAVLFKEMTDIDLADPAADLLVRLGKFSKKDSSTGYAQIFGYVALGAVNFAVDRNLATYESLGISCDHRLDRNNPADVRMIWKKLDTDPRFNMEAAALNLLSCAEEMTGRIDFSHYTPEELQLVLTRYNANVRHITDYGKQTYEYYLKFSRE